MTKHVYTKITQIYGSLNYVLYYIPADNYDGSFCFNISDKRHKFKDLQNCIRMVDDQITCWFHYVNRPLLFSALKR